MVLKPDQQRIQELLRDTITKICRNGLEYNSEFSVEALIGITLDQDKVFLVSVKETIQSSGIGQPTDTSHNDSDGLMAVRPSLPDSAEVGRQRSSSESDFRQPTNSRKRRHSSHSSIIGTPKFEAASHINYSESFEDSSPTSAEQVQALETLLYESSPAKRQDSRHASQIPGNQSAAEELCVVKAEPIEPSAVNPAVLVIPNQQAGSFMASPGDPKAYPQQDLTSGNSDDGLVTTISSIQSPDVATNASEQVCALT